MKTSPIPGFEPQLPHQRLIVWQRCMQLLLAVRAANIRDSKLRDEANRAVKGACLNIAEAASRKSRADQARAFAIARGEAMEACAAVEIAAFSGTPPTLTNKPAPPSGARSTPCSPRSLARRGNEAAAHTRGLAFVDVLARRAVGPLRLLA